MHIGVIGAGQLGATLAEWCVESGHDVAITSRHPERLGGLVERLGEHSVAVPVGEAAAYADAVLFAPGWSSAREAIDLAGDALTGKVVIDATNPPAATPDGRSGLETLMTWAPEAHWVKAFNTLPAGVLTRRRGHDPLLIQGQIQQRQYHQETAERLYARAARLHPDDADAQVAAAVGRFDMDDLSASFSRLGPLVKRFPKSQSVRYHLGLLLAWTGQRELAVKEFRAARALGSGTKLGRESDAFLGGLSGGGTSGSKR